MSPESLLTARRKDLSQLDYTYDLLSGLTDEQLEAVQIVAITFLKNTGTVKKTAESEVLSAFQPQSEEQLLTRIDHSLSQIDRGLYENAEQVENELLMGLEI